MEDDKKPQSAPEVKKRSVGRPKTMSDEARRAAIITLARKTFVELGFAGTTTDIVAARAKISKQTLYRLFASKNDLFIAVVAGHRQMMLDLPRPVGEDLPVAEALDKIFLLDIDEETDRERQAFVHLVMRESEQFPEIDEILYKEGVLRSLHNLADWLGLQRDNGKLEIDDTLSGARMLMDMIFGARRPPHRRVKDWLTSETRMQHVRRCIAIFSRGTAPRS